jgi:hypothetical protein
MQAQLPERAGCPQCGSIDGRRWRSFSGIELCTDCEWDYLSSLNERKLLDARSQIRDASIPSASKSPGVTPSVRRNPRQCLRLTTGNLSASRWRGGLDALGVKASPYQRSTRDIRPGTNSICLICSHIFYGAVLASCSRCGGLCRVHSDHGLELMARRAQAYVEAER